MRDGSDERSSTAIPPIIWNQIMGRVLVTVKQKGENPVADLELPADIPVSEWLTGMIELLGWAVQGVEAEHALHAVGPATEQSISISGDQTLASVGVRDGYWVVLLPSAARIEPSPPPPAEPQEESTLVEPRGEDDGPITGWDRSWLPQSSMGDPSEASDWPGPSETKDEAETSPSSLEGPGLDDWQTRVLEDEED
jgi:hypothetical protein